MRQRFAISIILPCLAWAWLCLPVANAQEKAAAPGREQPKAGAAAQPAADQPAAAPAAPAPKLDKYNDAHSNAMRQFKKGFISWPKLLLILVLILIWVRSCDWINQDT